MASTQGAVSSIYLLARCTTSKMAMRAVGTSSASMAASTLAGSSLIRPSSSPSTGSATGVLVTVPPKYFSHMATVRDSRLPRSLARSVLMRLMSASLVKAPSLPKGTSRSRK